MGDDKALGPDGFIVKFFRKAWEIVGFDVVDAIRDFFSTVITKILANRIKLVLAGLVDKAQATFVLGRTITDNVLLSQELVFQYHLHKGPLRCAMKVDLAKAYDVVEWDFLLANGGQGLRQRDPLSPYLFVLVMQVLHGIVCQSTTNSNLQFHWKYEQFRLVMLMFVDDLLLFSHGDPDSVRLLKSCLERFSAMSGLKANFSKSDCFISCTDEALREDLFNASGF
ncbi:uncharacterized protein LOC127802266 [Diospyros lotus]|uniref:uncharacterized protein LOC127802266 n=1 Tax=Diospyros lotus TaxID=55363 RepID=UPI00225912A5|nr:uncharacterized protein LOC127802266 [Diospyros lotus]